MRADGGKLWIEAVHVNARGGQLMPDSGDGWVGGCGGHISLEEVRQEEERDHSSAGSGADPDPVWA